jgi:hypothetical protein
MPVKRKKEILSRKCFPFPHCSLWLYNWVRGEGNFFTTPPNEASWMQTQDMKLNSVAVTEWSIDWCLSLFHQNSLQH